MTDREVPLRPGDMLYGYCGGEFDDVYEDKRVEAIGADWVVARTDSGGAVFYAGPPEALCRYRDDPAGGYRNRDGG